LLALILLALAVRLPCLLGAEETLSFAGTYRDDRITVDLDPPTSTSPNIYTGSIHLGDQKFRLKAEAQDERLKGTFESQGDQFDFSASVVGRMLVLTTDGTTYRLKKQIANPLARLPPSKPNPLAQLPASSLPALSAAPATNLPAVMLPVGAPLRLKRLSIWDDTNMIGGEAVSFLAPAGWQVEGGLRWRMHRAVPVYLALRASNPAHSEVLETFPTIPFVWTEGGIPLFPAGSNYMGNEVAEPLEDPLAYMQKILLPRFHPLLSGTQVVATEELPKIAEAIGQAAEEPGVQKKFRAARLRLEYVENGKAMQEDIYCVLAATYFPALHTTFWGPDRNYSFKAEKGKLDLRTRLFQSMINSFRPNLQWFNRYVQLVQVLMQNQLDTTQPLSELIRFVAATSPEVNDVRRQSYERQQAIQDRINFHFAQLVRGLEEYRNPFDGALLQLPSGYQALWAHPLGDLALSDDPAFNPNSSLAKDWQRLEKNH